MSGIGLRRRPDGHLYCFGVNPSPGFTRDHSGSGEKLAEPVAELLVTA